MKIKTLITTILLGTSTMAAVASAHPAQQTYGEQTWSSSRDHRSNQGQGRTQPGPDNGYYFQARFGGDYGGDFDPGYRRDLPQSFALKSSVPVVGGQQETWLIGDRVGSLRLDITRGSVFVSKIAVELGTGQMLVQQVNRTLSSRTASDPLIDLAGARDIRRVIVYTPNGGSAAYDIVSC